MKYLPPLLIPVCYFFILLLPVGNAFSATYTFTGGSGNLWSTSANWAGGNLPPNPLPQGNFIIISIGTICILDFEQTVEGQLDVNVGSELEIAVSTGILNINRSGFGNPNNIDGLMENRGTLNINRAVSSSQTQVTGSIHNYGTLNIQSQGKLVIRDGGNLTNFGGAVLNNTKTLEVRADCEVVNGGTLNNTATILLREDGFLENNSVLNNSGGLIKGTGWISGTVAFSNEGTISPGNSSGCLNTSVDFTNASAGTIEIEIGGTNACTEHDQIPGNTINLGGNLNISLINSFTPVAGQSFVIFTATTITGTFSNVTFPTVSGLEWNITYGSTDVTVNIDVALPVELMYFRAKPDQNQITLEWATASESNNLGYEILKSVNGKDWVNLEFVHGKGSTNAMTTYQYTDPYSYPSITYYRLKQIDFDGTSHLSKIISTLNSGNTDIRIFPNPSRGLITISGITTGRIRILNSQGRLILATAVQSEPLDVSVLPGGIYYLHIMSENQTVNKRLIIDNG